MDSLINQFNRACKEGNLELVKNLTKNTNVDINIQLLLDGHLYKLNENQYFQHYLFY